MQIEIRDNVQELVLLHHMGPRNWHIISVGDKYFYPVNYLSHRLFLFFKMGLCIPGWPWTPASTSYVLTDTSPSSGVVVFKWSPLWSLPFLKIPFVFRPYKLDLHVSPSCSAKAVKVPYQPWGLCWINLLFSCISCKNSPIRSSTLGTEHWFLNAVSLVIPTIFLWSPRTWC